MLLLQARGELCVCDLMLALCLSQPKVSRHLAELRKQHLVIDNRRGKWIYYQINPALENWQQEMLRLTAKASPLLIANELDKLLEINQQCKVNKC